MILLRIKIYFSEISLGENNITRQGDWEKREPSRWGGEGMRTMVGLRKGGGRPCPAPPQSVRPDGGAAHGEGLGGLPQLSHHPLLQVVELPHCPSA